MPVRQQAAPMPAPSAAWSSVRVAFVVAGRLTRSLTPSTAQFLQQAVKGGLDGPANMVWLVAASSADSGHHDDGGGVLALQHFGPGAAAHDNLSKVAVWAEFVCECSAAG